MRVCAIKFSHNKVYQMSLRGYRRCLAASYNMKYFSLIQLCEMFMIEYIRFDAHAYDAETVLATLNNKSNDNILKYSLAYTYVR